MADRAQVSSVEAIEAFRSALVIYLSKARPALEEISNEVLRSKQWLQNDQRRLWEGEMKMRAKKLERAKAELFSVSVSKFQQVSTAQQLIVHRAKQACEEAEKKLALLKKWDHELDSRAEPLERIVGHGQVRIEPPKLPDLARPNCARTGKRPISPNLLRLSKNPIVSRNVAGK